MINARSTRSSSARVVSGALVIAAALCSQSPATAHAQPQKRLTARLPGASARPVVHLISWKAGQITCDNGAIFSPDVIPTRIPDATSNVPEQLPRVIFSFTLGSEGRALGITASDIAGGRRYGSDLSPALAAARFDHQAGEAACAVTFSQTATPYDEAQLDDLMMQVIHSRRRAVPRDAWQNIVPGDCFANRKRPLEIHTPDYRKLPKRPGANHWVFVSYDIDAEGKPINLETAGSTGNAAIETASRRAVAASRWIDEDPRTGCWRYDWTAADVITAPKAPPAWQFGEQPEQCEADDRWSKTPVLNYPKAYQRRGIEGWAVLRYDVASWGEIGNVETLAAQPASEFGSYAEGVLTSARYATIEGGLTGCIETVIFKLPQIGAETDGADQ